MERARKDALALDDRMQRMAELDARKALLREKRIVLDEAFALALKKMQAMPAAQAKRYAMAVLLDAARGDETLIADADSAWCDAAFVREANVALAAAGREGKLRLSGEKRALGGGFLLVRGGMEVKLLLRGRHCGAPSGAGGPRWPRCCFREIRCGRRPLNGPQ